MIFLTLNGIDPLFGLLPWAAILSMPGTGGRAFPEFGLPWWYVRPVVAGPGMPYVIKSPQSSVFAFFDMQVC